MTADPLQAAAAHIDPVLFAEALAELDWTPRAELEELINIIREGESTRHKMGAMQILRSRIIENLELSGAIQLIQERIRGQLPGGQYTAERSRYLSSDAASTTHEHLKTLSTERLDVDTAPSTLTENSNDDDTDAGTDADASRSSARVRRDDLADEPQGDGPGPEEPDERPPTPDPGDPPERAPAGTGHPGGTAASTPPAGVHARTSEEEETKPATGAGEDAALPETLDDPFRRRDPDTRPAFGRPLGRRTPTKPTIGGGICGPATKG